MKRQLTVIGTNHQKKLSRIWIEGRRLIEAGFPVGTRYHRKAYPGGMIILYREDKTDLPATHKVSGKGDKPIIDTSGFYALFHPNQ